MRRSTPPGKYRSLITMFKSHKNIQNEAGSIAYGYSENLNRTVVALCRGSTTVNKINRLHILATNPRMTEVGLPSSRPQRGVIRIEWAFSHHLGIVVISEDLDLQLGANRSVVR